MAREYIQRIWKAHSPLQTNGVERFPFSECPAANLWSRFARKCETFPTFHGAQRSVAAVNFLIGFFPSLLRCRLWAKTRENITNNVLILGKFGEREAGRIRAKKKRSVNWQSPKIPQREHYLIEKEGEEKKQAGEGGGGGEGAGAGRKIRGFSNERGRRRFSNERTWNGRGSKVWQGRCRAGDNQFAFIPLRGLLITKAKACPFFVRRPLPLSILISIFRAAARLVGRSVARWLGRSANV